jgi:hypothetical protein
MMTTTTTSHFDTAASGDIMQLTDDQIDAVGGAGLPWWQVGLIILGVVAVMLFGGAASNSGN